MQYFYNDISEDIYGAIVYIGRKQGCGKEKAWKYRETRKG
jgi:hypothetical protein